MKKWGIQREPPPFVLPDEFVNIFGGVKSPNFENFQALCCRALNTLRPYFSLLLCLYQMVFNFQLSLHYSILPFLKFPQQILGENFKEKEDNLTSPFILGLTDDEVSQKFRNLVKIALQSTTCLLNLGSPHLLLHRDGNSPWQRWKRGSLQSRD